MLPVAQAFEQAASDELLAALVCRRDLGEPDAHGGAELADEALQDVVRDRGAAVGAGEVGLVDQAGHRLPELRRPQRVRVRLDHILDVAQDVGRAQGVDQDLQLGVVVEGVPVVDDDPGHPREQERLEAGLVAAGESEQDVPPGRCREHGGLLALRADLQRGLVEPDDVRGHDLVLDGGQRRGDQGGGLGEQAVDPAGRHRDPGELADQLDDPLDREVLAYQQVERQRAQVLPVGHRPGRQPGRLVGDMATPATAPDPVHVVLDHGRHDRQQVVGLVGPRDPDDLGAVQPSPAGTVPGRVVRLDAARVISPGQGHPVGARLLPPPALRAGSVLLRRLRRLPARDHPVRRRG